MEPSARASHLRAEAFDPRTRRQILARLRAYLDGGWRDPELLYLGARYAASLGLGGEVERFLGPLDEQLGLPGSPCALAAPLALLRWHVAGTVEKREGALRQLEAAVFHEPRLYPALRRLGLRGPPPPGTPRAVLDRAACSPGALEPSEKLAQLSAAAVRAASAYATGDLPTARAALDDMLRLDGDQPDVLRDALVVAAEQRDIEGYEGYWRRYVTVLLWHLLHGDQPVLALLDLRAFYSDVAARTDKEVEGATAENVQKALHRPGFLPRWLEAHGALVWLEAGMQGWAELQADVDEAGIAQGRRGALGLMRFWVAAFYPEFVEHLLDWMPDVGSAAPPEDGPRLTLPFDPVARMLRRCIQWGRIQFGLRGAEDLSGPYGEVLRAFGSFVLRLPYQRHLRALAAAAAEDKAFPSPLNQKPIGLELREAAGLPLRVRVHELIQAEDWAGILALLDDEDLLAGVSAELTLFLALACCKSEHPSRGLEVACRLLPRMVAEDLAEGSQPAILWHNVLHANLQAATAGDDQASSMARLEEVHRALEAIPEAPASAAYRAERVAEVGRILEHFRNQVVVRRAIDSAKELVGQHRFDEARASVAAIPDSPEELRDLKANIGSQIDQAEAHHALERAVEEVRAAVGRGDFAAARAAVARVPDGIDQVREVKENILGQIAQAEAHKALERAVEESKRAVGRGDFAAARAAIRRVPDADDQVREVKGNILGQIDDAEQQARRGEQLRAQVEAAVEESKRAVGRGDFAAARRTIDRLPDDPALGDLKRNLRGQIADAERQARRGEQLRAQVDGAVDEAKQAVGRGDFAAARRAIDRLPDEPALEDLKRNFRDQVAEAERQANGALDEARDILDRLGRRGVDFDRLWQVARDNDIDITNPVQFLHFLKAVERQI